MKLEEGIYVRTKDGEFGKINKIIGKYIFINTNQYAHFKHHIKITSNNIIDLIEVGDYVNGSEVTSIEENGWLGFGDNDWYIPNSGGIKSIVTKEQFESIKYSLEG